MSAIKSEKGAIIIKVRVLPNSSKTKIDGIIDDQIKIKLASPPIDGRANKELIKFLSKFLNVPKGNIEIKVGEKSRNKVLKIEGITLEEAERKLRDNM